MEQISISTLPNWQMCVWGGGKKMEYIPTEDASAKGYLTVVCS